MLMTPLLEDLGFLNLGFLSYNGTNYLCRYCLDFFVLNYGNWVWEINTNADTLATSIAVNN